MRYWRRPPSWRPAAARAASARTSGQRAAPAGAPQRGGTLTMLGQSDIFNLDTVSAYYTVSNMLERMFTRQLFSYGDPTGTATRAAGRARHRHHDPDGRQRRHHRRREDAHDPPPAGREVGHHPGPPGHGGRLRPRVQDAVQPGLAGRRARLLHATRSSGWRPTAPGSPRCRARWPGSPATSTPTRWRAWSRPATSTLTFHLLSPTPDFLYILTMGFCSARPVEYMSYVPDSATFRAHTLSDGPYQITSYTAGKSITLDRNPAWSASTDPLRHAYVNKINITEGLTADSVQQQLVAGTGDMEWDVVPPAQDLPSLVAQKSSRPGHRPDRAGRRVDRARHLPDPEPVRRAAEEQAGPRGGGLRGQQERHRADPRRQVGRLHHLAAHPARQRRLHPQLQPVPGQQRQRRPGQGQGSCWPRPGRPASP